VKRLTPALLSRLLDRRGWTREAIERLGLQFDDERVCFPVRDETGELLGRTRYQPNPERLNRQPKMVADRGTSRELFPPPETIGDEEAAGLVWLVEGEPDAVRVWALDLAAVAVPGAQNWQDKWAARFSGRRGRVMLAFDCDQAGRSGAQRVAESLASAGVDARILDIDPQRNDGYDLSDFLAAARTSGERDEARRILLRCAEAVPEISFPRDPRKRAGPERNSRLNHAGLRANFDSIPAHKSLGTGTESERLPFRPLGEALRDAPEEPDWLVRGMLARTLVTVVEGARRSANRRSCSGC
jgi:Toprim-like